MKSEIVIEDEENELFIEDYTIKVKFVHTYIGELGTYYRNKIYELSIETYEMLKMDCIKEE